MEIKSGLCLSSNIESETKSETKQGTGECKQAYSTITKTGRKVGPVIS